MSQITIFFDGRCPLCFREMCALKQQDVHNCITLIDIHSPDMADYPAIDLEEAQRILLAYDAQGRLVRGLDTLHLAWSLVGKPWLYALTRWSLIRPLADRAYLWFARHRDTLSGWLTGQRRCPQGQCRPK
ncbi:thiol-disulfide oxidoreductase DCC family protein [Vibrio furnissii]|uniref:thiol-disulfide oxidoreductase DCC family protein n=1 Tax=Vibrio furnissii TaxID=29494 RepID=UPI001180D94D|nr:DCC1-like thiol-disulfide oxidoreductase family protein [Vibrio furnissii]TRN24677.1 cell division inhibitor [Vibrio furnissii]